MTYSASVTDPTPMTEMNMTPLIDVMLVLLIMFIITIPLQTHAVRLDLPTDCSDCPEPNPLRNIISVTESGAILWNGKQIRGESFAYMLAATQRINPAPELHLQPQPEAPYRVIDEVLAISKRARVENMGFIGNERYRDF